MNEERWHSPGPAALRTVAMLKSVIPHLMDQHQTPGLNVALAFGGRLVWEAGFGWADVAARRPMTPDTVYRSGSLGKVYTATAIMILVDRGVISLDDPINDHLPFQVRNPLGEREILVRDLMVHRSGLGDDAAGSEWGPGLPLGDYLEAQYARDTSPMMGGALPRWLYPVGASWRYSNLGIATLGLIVEVANPDRLGFSEFVQTEIMDPLGMTLSQYPIAQHQDHVRADIWAAASTGYSRMGEADVPSFPLVFGQYPAGGVMARPADHIRLLLAMLKGGALDGHRLFSEAIARSMICPATDLPAGAPGEIWPEAQGLVWMLTGVGRPSTSFHHAGGHMFGWRTQGRAWPAHGAALMVAVNQWALPDDGDEAQELGEIVNAWLKHHPLTDSRDLSALPAETMSYARGAIAAALYHVALGVPGGPPDGSLTRILADTTDRRGDFDAVAFRKGFEAVMALPPTLEAVQAFFQSPDCAISLADLAEAAKRLGAQSPGFLTPLLPQ